MDRTGELFPQHECGPMGGSICQRGRLRFSPSEREWDSPSLMASFEVSTDESALPRAVLAPRLFPVGLSSAKHSFVQALVQVTEVGQSRS